MTGRREVVAARVAAGIATPSEVFWLRGQARLEASGVAVEAVRAAAVPPSACGPEIPVAPAAGPRVAFHYVRWVDGSRERTVPAGHLCRATARGADVFDRMAADAVRRKSAAPFTAHQVAAARDYRTMAERHAAGGVRCASLEAGRVGGGGGEFIDAHIDLGRRLAGMRGRIGPGVALRASRGEGRTITCRALVEAVCVGDQTFSRVLKRHGWPPKGAHRAALRKVLAAALDRMRTFA